MKKIKSTTQENKTTEKKTMPTINEQAVKLMKKAKKNVVYLCDGLWYFDENNANGEDVKTFTL